MAIGSDSQQLQPDLRISDLALIAGAFGVGVGRVGIRAVDGVRPDIHVTSQQPVRNVSIGARVVPVNVEVLVEQVGVDARETQCLLAVAPDQLGEDPLHRCAGGQAERR